ncbi:MAG: hypothetical protein RSB10_03955 [Clostridia bacterium]
MKKKVAFCILIFVLTALMCITAVGCKPHNLEKPLAPRDWQDYIDELAVFYVNGMRNGVKEGDTGKGDTGKGDTGKGDAVKVDDPNQIHYRISLDFDYDMESSTGENISPKDAYYLDINANMNLASSVPSQNNGYIKFFRRGVGGAENTLLFGLMSDNENFYICANENKIRIPNAPVFDIAKRLLFEEKQADVATFFAQLAKIIFVDAYANSDKSVYTLVFDIKKMFLSDNVKGFVKALPFEAQTTLYKLAGATNYDEFVLNLPYIGGKMSHHIDNGKVTQVKITDGVYRGSETSGAFAMTTKAWSVDSKVDTEAKLGVPISNDLSYETINIGQMSANGTVDLVGEKGNKFVTYKYSFICDLNFLELVANGGDFYALPDDNFFHLRISHVCASDENSAYCKARTAQSNGAVLDIAMSKQDFGTKNIYASVNVKTAFSRAMVKQLLNTASDLNFLALISDYKLFTIDPRDYFKANTKLSGGIAMMLGLLQYPSDASASIKYSDIKKALSMSERMAQIVDANFTVGDEVLDKIVVNSTSLTKNMRPSQENIFNETINIVNASGALIKTYSDAILDQAKPALAWDFFEKSVWDDKVVYNIYKNEALIFGNKDQERVLLTASEAKDLTGCNVKYKYTDLLGNKVDAPQNARILSVSGLDLTVFDKPQRVKLKLSYPSQIFGSSLATEIGKYFDLDSILYVTLDCNITLVQGNVEIKRTDTTIVDGKETEKTFYDFGSAFDSKMLAGEALVRVDNSGASKTINVKGVAEGLTKTSTSFLFDSGEFDIKYNIFGQEYIKKIVVGEPGNNKYEFVDIKNDHLVRKVKENIFIRDLLGQQSVRITFPDGSQSKISPSLNDLLFINGKSITRESSNFWELSSWRIVFKKDGKYTVTYNFFGVIKRDFELQIDKEEVVLTESSYFFEDKTHYRDIYFTDYAYNFDADIKNLTVGNVDAKNQTIKIVVERGYTNQQTGALAWTETKENYSVTKSTIDDKPFVSDATAVDLPALALNPIRLRTQISFAKSGYYRVNIFVGKTKYVSNAIKVETSVPLA